MTLGELQTTDGNHIIKTTLVRSIENEVPQDRSNHIQKENVTPLFNAIKSSRLVQLLRKSITTMPKKPVKSKFIFENTIDAAESNMKLIQEYDFNIDNIFKSEPDSTIQPKFEFRDQSIVSDLFDLSTDGEKLKNICFQGVTYPFRDDVDTSDETRIADAEYWLEKGNNNSAKGEEVLIHKMIGKEVSNSWGIVFPRKDCLSVEGAGIMPATVAEK